MRYGPATRSLVQALVERLPHGVAVLDSEGRYHWINERLARDNGLSVDQHRGHRMADLFPALWQLVEPSFRSVFDGGREVTFTGERTIQPHGEMEWTAIYTPIFGEGMQVEWLLARVIGETPQEKRLRESVRRAEDQLLQLGLSAGGR